MAEDFGTMIEKLQQTLQEEGGADKLKQMMNGMLGASSQPTPEQKGFGELNPESLIKIKTIYDRLHATDDPRTSLLTALRPYLNIRRASQVDTAVRILSLTKLSGIIKEIL